MILAGIPLEEYGDTVKMEGVIVGDGHKRRLLYFPGEGAYFPEDIGNHVLSLEEALAWLKQTDDPTSPIYSDELNKIVKAVVRKGTRQVDQNVAWKCYERSGYACEYCGIKSVPLTYDHALAQAYGGKTTLENGVAACRPCNKTKGHMTWDAWMNFMHEKGMIYASRLDSLLVM